MLLREAPPRARIQAGERATARCRIEAMMAQVRDGQAEAVLGDIEAALARAPDDAAAWYGMAAVASQNRRFAAAVLAAEKAHEADPEDPLFAELLAVLHATAGNLAMAMYFAKLSVAYNLDDSAQALLPVGLPTLAVALDTIRDKPLLATAKDLLSRRLFREAAEAFDDHLAAFPDEAAAVRGAAEALFRNGEPDGALAVLEPVLADPSQTFPEDFLLLGRVSAALGDVERAARAFTVAADRGTDPVLLEAFRLDAWTLDPTIPAAEMAPSARRLAAGLLVPEAVGSRPPAGSPPEGRRLAVGILAAGIDDPRDLAMVRTVAAALDRIGAASIVLYAQGLESDAANGALRGAAREWNNLAELDPVTAAAVIRGDRLDVLIDAVGLADPVRARALAQYPARCQVAWLGQPLAATRPGIDAYLAGTGEAGAGDAHLCSLDSGIYAYEPMLAPRAWRVPGRRFAFGADLALAQMQPELLAAWARIMAANPGAVLVLRNRFDHAEQLIPLVSGRFQEAGLETRVDLLKDDDAAFCAAVDLGLAPFFARRPHDAAMFLSHGVPVVAVAGPERRQRQAADLLVACGLDELVAADRAGYVELACRLAQSDDAAATARVRDRIAEAAAFNPNRFAADLDRALRRLLAEMPA